MVRRCYKDIDIYRVYRADSEGESMVNFGFRMSDGKFQIKKNLNNKEHPRYNCSLYRYIREHGGLENFIFERLERYPSNTKLEALDRIEQLREKYNACLTLTLLPILDHETNVVCSHGQYCTKDNIVCKQCKYLCKHDTNKYVCPLCSQNNLKNSQRNNQ